MEANHLQYKKASSSVMGGKTFEITIQIQFGPKRNQDFAISE